MEFGTLEFFLVFSKFLYFICCLYHDSWLELGTWGLCCDVVYGHYFALSNFELCSMDLGKPFRLVVEF